MAWRHGVGPVTFGARHVKDDPLGLVIDGLGFEDDGAVGMEELVGDIGQDGGAAGGGKALGDEGKGGGAELGDGRGGGEHGELRGGGGGGGVPSVLCVLWGGGRGWVG